MRVNVGCLTLTLIAPAAPLFGANPLGDESFGIQGKATEKGHAKQYSEDPRQALLPGAGSGRERPPDELLKT
jgi:hypothetical protein